MESDLYKPTDQEMANTKTCQKRRYLKFWKKGPRWEWSDLIGPAGHLLEEVGAKGERVGDIQVADFHCNFIINTGNGKAKDIKELADRLKGRVKEKFDVELKEEVKYFR